MWSRIGPDTRRVLLGAIAVVVAVAVGIGALVAAERWVGRGGSAAVAGGPGAGGAPASPTKPVSFHGVEVRVPRSWPLNALRCGTPVRDTAVVAPGIVTSCLISPQPVVSVAELKSLREAEASGDAAVADRAVEIGGHPARRGEDRLPDGRTRVVLALPDLDAVVVAKSRDAALAGGVIASARVAPVDAAGCADRVRELRAGPPRRGGAVARMVPGTPVAGALCRYSDLRLQRSAALGGDQLQRLTAQLDATPAGTSRPGGGYQIDPSACPQEQRRGFVARFRYLSGPPLEVVVHIGGCGPLGVSNGTRSAKLSPALVSTLTGLVGYDGGYPDPRQLR